MNHRFRACLLSFTGAIEQPRAFWLGLGAVIALQRIKLPRTRIVTVAKLVRLFGFLLLHKNRLAIISGLVYTLC